MSLPLDEEKQVRFLLPELATASDAGRLRAIIRTQTALLPLAFPGRHGILLSV